MTAWAGVVGTALYILNAFIGDRLERRWTSSSALSALPSAILSCTGRAQQHGRVHRLHSCDYRCRAVAGACTCTYPVLPDPDARAGTADRRRRHLGAWGGVLIAGALFSLTTPGPSSCSSRSRAHSCPHLDRDLRKNQRNRTLEELSRRRWAAGRAVSRRLFPECLRRHKQGVTGGPALTGAASVNAELDGGGSRPSVARGSGEPTGTRPQSAAMPTGSRQEGKPMSDSQTVTILPPTTRNSRDPACAAPASLAQNRNRCQPRLAGLLAEPAGAGAPVRLRPHSAPARASRPRRTSRPRA